MHTPRILVLDENLEIAQLEQAMFQLHQYNVDVTVHAEEALRRLMTRRYDVVVVGAPIVIANRFFLDIIRSDFADLIPATVVVTSHIRDASLLQRCGKTGVYAVIGKPFDVHDLSDLVAQCIANEAHPAETRWIGIPPGVVQQNDSRRE